jgi:hypothetical protein
MPQLTAPSSAASIAACVPEFSTGALAPPAPSDWRRYWIAVDQIAARRMRLPAHDVRLLVMLRRSWNRRECGEAMNGLGSLPNGRSGLRRTIRGRRPRGLPVAFSQSFFFERRENSGTPGLCGFARRPAGGGARPRVWHFTRDGDQIEALAARAGRRGVRRSVP